MKNAIQRIIGTLKTIDVRGFDSMDKLVGCVIALENLLNDINEEGENDGR